MQRFDEYVGGFVPGVDPPPHIYANFTVKEDNITSPRYLRLVTTSVALDAKSQTALGVPIACVWQPLSDLQPGEDQPPICDVTAKGPFRCSRCLAYANPFFAFPDLHSVTCNLCGLTQPCPSELATDRASRPELLSGTYDYQVAKEFIVKPAPLNTFLVCLDVSIEAVTSGLPLHVINSLKAIVDYIPSPDRSRIAIMTYSDRFIYYRPADSGQTTEVVINETEDPFVADSIDALAFHLHTQKESFLSLLETLERKISTMQPGKQLLSPCAVITAAKDLLDPAGGRVLLFLSSLGTIGKFSLRGRDDQRLYNTENEKNLYMPQHEGIHDLASVCCAAGITIDCFACGKGYLDTASMYPLCAVTGGDLHYFPNYSLSANESLHFTLVRTLTRTQIFQVLMRVRCSNGIAVDDYIGNYLRRGPTDMEAAYLDPDKSFTILLKHEEKLKDNQKYYLQAAMLYTSIEGKRFIRVFNTAVTATSDTMGVFKTSDCETLSTVLMKKQVLSIFTVPLRTIREHWQENIVSLLAYYRTNSAASKETTSLMLPETLNFLPLFTLTAIKTAVFNSRTGVDSRISAICKLKSQPLISCFLSLYPRIYSVHDIMEQPQQPGVLNGSEMVALPSLVPASAVKIVPTGAYLMDNGEGLVMYVGPAVHSEFLLDVFVT